MHGNSIAATYGLRTSCKTFESAISFSRIIAKHFMGSDIRVSKSEDGKTIMLIIRHDVGNGFSFFCSRCFEHFFIFFDVNRVSVDYDDTTVIISIVTVPEEKADISAVSTSYLNQQQINAPLTESEMRDYLEVTKEISKWRKIE
jgi:hypothetical protein